MLNSDGRAVGTDTAGNTATYAGQIFFNPVAGQVGDLPILAFDAPDVFVVNAALMKRFTIVGRSSLQFSIEASNLFNTVSFCIGDQNINSTTFGRISQLAVPARIVQLTLCTRSSLVSVAKPVIHCRIGLS